MIIATIAAQNYAAHALALAKSLQSSMPGAKRVLCVVESKNSLPHQVESAFNHIVLAHDLELPDKESFFFRHNVAEASTAIKASLLLRLLDHFLDEDLFVFLDPDIVVYSGFEELESLQQCAGVVVTPHLLGNETNPNITGAFLFRMLNAGIFNLGFLAIKRSAESRAFLQWWRDRLLSWCYFDLQRGMFVDQKWVDFSLGLFDLTVLRHVGYNVAHWNLRNRTISNENGNLECNGQPLRFVHFSGMTSESAIATRLRSIASRNFVHGLARDYLNDLASCGQKEFEKFTWSYATFSSGERISREAQAAYRSFAALRKQIPEPFNSSNSEIVGAYEKEHYGIC